MLKKRIEKLEQKMQGEKKVILATFRNKGNKDKIFYKGITYQLNFRT